MSEMKMEDVKLSKVPRIGEIVKGIVLDIKDNQLIIDLKTFTEGIMYIDKFSLDRKLSSFEGLISVGDEIEASVAKVDEEHGSIFLTRIPVLRKQMMHEVEQVVNEQQIVTVQCRTVVPEKGLRCVYKDNDVFIPASEIHLEEGKTLETFLNKSFKVRFMKNDRERKDRRRSSYLASQRQVASLEYREAKEKEWNEIKEGDVLTGVVYKVENYGAFVKFAYNTGLIRFDQLSHSRKPVKELVNIDDKIEVKVIRKTDSKIDLSRKILLETPFSVYSRDHSIGDLVKGIIVQKLPFGVILLLTDDVTALLHRYELSWNPNDNSLASLKIGMEVEAQIIGIDPVKEKISLSQKSLVDNPWSRVKAKEHDITEAVVTQIISGKGLSVTAYGVDGFIPISEIVMKSKSTKLEDYYAVGDKVIAVVTLINVKTWELVLSIKRHSTQVERDQFEEYLKKQNEEEEKITIGQLFEDILKE